MRRLPRAPCTAWRVARLVRCGACVGAAALLVSASLHGHKPVAAKYTYNEDIYPIFRQHCGACHVPGGVAPMSLLSYEEAYPWAESIKEEVVNLRMPPWHADEAYGAFIQPSVLTASEIDRVMDWAWGGTPEGNPANRPEPMSIENDWRLGTPDRVLEMPGDEGLPADRSEGTRVVMLATGLAEPRWVEAVDLLPGNPAIVRHATVTLVEGGTRLPLAAWVPGQAPVRRVGVALRLPAEASLELAIHYRKTWTNEGLEARDRSAVGLYFSRVDRPVELRRVAVEPPTGTGMPRDGSSGMSFALTADADLEVVALRPDVASPGLDVRVEAVGPDGSQEPMLRIEGLAPEWQRRYWFERPVPLARGGRIVVTVTRRPGGVPVDPSAPRPRVWVDVVPMRPDETARP